MGTLLTNTHEPPFKQLKLTHVADVAIEMCVNYFFRIQNEFLNKVSKILPMLQFVPVKPEVHAHV